MDAPDQSLKEISAEAKDKQSRLEELDPRSENFKDTLRSAIEDLEKCKILIEKNSIFSPNEDVEDIATHDLQFLAVDYTLADLLTRSYGNDRLASLKRAADLLQSFLSRLDLYEILSSTDRKLYEQYQENRSAFSISGMANAEERRKIKIKRFQEEKLLKQKLEHLRTQSQINHADDEVVRNLYITELGFFTNQAFQALDMITQESSMLAQMQQIDLTRSAQTFGDDDRIAQRTTGYSERLDGPMTLGGLGRKGGPLLSPSGKPLQPFTLTDKRTQLRQGVFRPGHNLPTMSIDEYLEEEKRRGGIIDGGGNANAPEPELDEDNMVQVDAATLKAREWDEFVEANPKGAGNTINRG